MPTNPTPPPAFLAAALGDSITTAYNADAGADNLALSWSTGAVADVKSHAHRLRSALPHVEVATLNAAAAGARAVALAGQAERVAAARPDYATLLVGANDLTDWLMLGDYGARLDRFHADVARAVDRLIAANPRLMLVLAGIPDQSRVVDVLLRGAGMPLPSWLDPSLVATVKARYRERHERANAALADVARGRPRNVRFAGGVAAHRFEREHLSALDRYHPSRLGHAALAERTWAEGWF
jgi:lysophospholipase L1-like esterase